MWGRERNRVNPGIVPAGGRSSRNRGIGCSSSLNRTHSRTALGSNRDGGGSRGYSSGGGGSSGRRGNRGGRARVRSVDRGRGGVVLRTWGLKLCPPHVFTMAGLRKEMRGWDENERRGGGGGGGFK